VKIITVNFGQENPRDKGKIMDVKKQIIALGGGGIGTDKLNMALDKYKLHASGKTKPKIAFIPTAVGDSAFAIERFYRAFNNNIAEPSHLPLFNRDDRNLENYLLNQDIIEVSGGNTLNMLSIWENHGVDKILKKAWEKGIILTGSSAGMICWFESSVTDSYGPLKELTTGLGFLKGSACPHFDGEIHRRPTYEALIKSKILPSGIALDDYVAAHYINEKIHKLVTPKEGSKGYLLNLEENKINEKVLNPDLLNA
jgi:dipeptidase E